MFDEAYSLLALILVCMLGGSVALITVLAVGILYTFMNED